MEGNCNERSSQARIVLTACLLFEFVVLPSQSSSPPSSLLLSCSPLLCLMCLPIFSR